MATVGVKGLKFMHLLYTFSL